MYKPLWLLCLCWLSFTTVAAEIYDKTHYQQHVIQPLTVPDEGLSFLVLGDWGRNGHYAQRQVAKWMDIAMYQLDAEFIATTGDNFYINGVASIDDPYWQTSFENIYHGPHLFADWYATLGNHDYRGNWQAQIDYSNKSRRWNMPAQYYARHWQLQNGAEVLILFIDTSPLNPAYQTQEKYAEAARQDAASQLGWIKQQLAGSQAHWKIVIGHHPLYSSGKRYGKTQGIRSVLEPIFEQYKVDAYYAGHEHDLQYNQPEGTQVAHYVSGGGSKIRAVAKREFTRFATSQAGFAAVSLTANALLTQFINADGQVVFQHRIQKNQQ